MDDIMLDITRTIKSKAMEYTDGLTVEFTLETGILGSKME